MQHLEIVTRHAIEMGTKEDVVSGFTPGLITPGFLRTAFGLEGLSTGISEMVLSLIDRDHEAVRATNLVLLKSADDICPGIDQGCFRRLLGIIKSHIGIGKGTFFSSMKSMPQDFAVVQMGLWLRDESIKGLDLKLIESVLEHSLARGRYHVAHAMCEQMASRGADVELNRCLVAVPYEKIESGALGKYISKETVVTALCDRKAFHQAKNTAGDDLVLDQIVRDSIGKQLGLRSASKNWVELFEKLTEQMEEVVDQQQLIDRHKSAALVIFNQITQLNPHSVKEQINTDRLRLFAFQLGVRDVLGSIVAGPARDRAFTQDLGL